MEILQNPSMDCLSGLAGEAIYSSEIWVKHNYLLPNYGNDQAPNPATLWFLVYHPLKGPNIWCGHGSVHGENNWMVAGIFDNIIGGLGHIKALLYHKRATDNSYRIPMEDMVDSIEFFEVDLHYSYIKYEYPNYARYDPYSRPDIGCTIEAKINYYMRGSMDDIAGFMMTKSPDVVDQKYYSISEPDIPIEYNNIRYPDKFIKSDRISKTILTQNKCEVDHKLYDPEEVIECILTDDRFKTFVDKKPSEIYALIYDDVDASSPNGDVDVYDDPYYLYRNLVDVVSKIYRFSNYYIIDVILLRWDDCIPIIDDVITYRGHYRTLLNADIFYSADTQARIQEDKLHSKADDFKKRHKKQFRIALTKDDMIRAYNPAIHHACLNLIYAVFGIKRLRPGNYVKWRKNPMNYIPPYAYHKHNVMVANQYIKDILAQKREE